MNTSKFFLSTLVAAAAMTANAYAVTSSSTYNYDDSITYSGEIWSVADAESKSGLNSISFSQYTADDDSSTMSSGTAGTGSSYWGKFAAVNESESLGNTLRFYTATSTNLTFTADYSKYVWLGGLITGAGDYGYTFGRSNCYMKLKGNAGVGVNMNIASDMTLWADTKIDVETSGSWSIASGKTLTLRSSDGVNLASGVTVSIGDSGTLAIASDVNGSAGTISGSGILNLTSGTLANATLSSGVTVAAGSGSDAKNLSGVTFGSGAILDLSGVTLSTDSAIFTATGAVTFTEGAVINLDSSAIKEGTTYSVLTTNGGTITGWNSDTLTFTFDGVAMAGRQSVSLSDYGFSYSKGVTYDDLVWSGTQTVWNNTDSDDAWTRSSDSTGTAYSFADNDSVTFATSNATVTVEGMVVPTSMVVNESTTFTGTGTIETGSVAVASAKTLKVSDGVSLTVSSTLALAADSVLSGDGRIDLGAAGKLTRDSSDVNLSNDTNSASWKGTIAISGRDYNKTSLGSGITIGKFANANSTVELSGVQGYVIDNQDNTAKTFTVSSNICLKDGDYGYGYKTVNGNSGWTNVFTGKISGDGTLEHAWAHDATKGFKYKFSGDISEWTGVFKQNIDRTTDLIFTGDSLSQGVNVGIESTAGTLNVTFDTSDSFTYSGSISGSSAITIGTGGVLTLDGTYANTGTITFSSGTTIWKATNNNGNTHHTIVVGSESTLDLTHSALFTDTTHVSNGRVTVRGVLKVADMTYGDSSTSFGKLQYNSGTISVDGGEIVFTKTNDVLRTLNITTSGGTITAEAGTGVEFTGNTHGFAIETSSSGGGELVLNAIGDIKFNGGDKGIITGSGSVKKSGAGTLTLSGNNTYTGDTTISQGVLTAMHNNALGAAGSSVKIDGGQLEVSENVTLAQTAITIVLGDANQTSISGAGALAEGTKITLDYAASTENVALMIATEETTKTYELVSGNVGGSLTKDSFVIGSGWDDGWKVTDYVYNQDTGVGTLTLGIPEPSAFGVLAGLGALALTVSRRRRMKKA